MNNQNEIATEVKKDMKTYKKEYYQKNKEKITSKLYAKETCPCCSRKVSHQHMNDHQKTASCIKKKTATLQTLIYIKKELNSTDSYYDDLIAKIMNVKPL